MLRWRIKLTAEMRLKMTTPKDNLTIQKSQSWEMFNSISSNYDFLNHLLSFGLDIHWRKKLAQLAPARAHLKLLDLATGTADVIISLFKNNKNIESAVGIDLAEKMLQIGQGKINQAGLGDKVKLQIGNAGHLLLPSDHFDITTMSFGIRNTTNSQQVLKEIYRVLKNEGRALILEFSMPSNAFFRTVHLGYLRFGVPVIGFIFSGHYKAYKYLNQTIENFPYGKDFCRLMEQEGFKNVAAHQLLWGVATIYVGDKIR